MLGKLSYLVKMLVSLLWTLFVLICITLYHFFQEPVAFMGGLFAGLLRLDLNEDPLKEWVTKTVEASGITAEEIAREKSESEEESPQRIEIE